MLVECDDGSPSWTVDREAVKGLSFLQGGPDVRFELTPLRRRLLDEAELASARRRTLQVLGQRSRSEKELRRILGAWPFRQAMVDDAVRWARELGYVDDRRLAREVLAQRMAHAPRGRELLRAEMEERGIPAETAAEALEEEFPEETERQAALAAAASRKASLEHLPVEKRAERLYRLLLQRAFPQAIARWAVGEVLGSEARRLLEPPE